MWKGSYSNVLVHALRNGHFLGALLTPGSGRTFNVMAGAVHVGLACSVGFGAGVYDLRAWRAPARMIMRGVLSWCVLVA